MTVAERLGEQLRATGFCGARAVALRAEGGGLIPPFESLFAVGRPDDGRLAVLLSLFADCHRVSRSRLQEALAPLALDELEEAGLIKLEGAHATTCQRLSEFEDLILAGDEAVKEKDPAHVSAVTVASQMTSHMTIRREVGSAADLGTGSGVQALLASRHAGRVVGVDINQRALCFGRLSQRLNGIGDSVSWVEGSWMQPLAGQRFDLIVANPPYVISPENEYLYRDTEASGDELSRDVVRAAAGALNDGGFATVMCNWIHPRDDWEGPVRAWIDGLGCDALILRQFSNDPIVYAMVWHRTLAIPRPEDFREGVDRWVAHYRRTGIEQIATGFVVLRRRLSATNWIQPFDIGRPRGSGSDQLQRMFRGADFLHAGTGPALLGQLLSRPWRLLDGHRLSQSTIYVDGAYVGEGAMTCEPDIGVHATIDPAVLPVLLGCDGATPLGELIEQAPIPEGMDRAGFHSTCISAARDLIARGYLLGVEDS